MSNGKTPTTEQIAEDLRYANEWAEWFGYGYDAERNTIVIEQYSDDGTIAKTYQATVSIEEVI